jgi:hypothetical protein
MRTSLRVARAQSDANLAPSISREGDQKMHKKDREIIDVAEHTDQVMFQKSTRPTQSGFKLPMLVHERLGYSP